MTTKTVLALGLLVAIAIATEARSAPACYINVTPLDFGSIDPTLGTSVTTTGSVTANCSADAGSTVRVCLDLGSGIGGSSPDGEVRYLLNGESKYAFNVYRDAAKTAPWANSGDGAALAIDVPIGQTGSGSASRTIWGATAAGQNSAAAGRYSTFFFGADLVGRYAENAAGDCNALPVQGTTSAAFRVDATVVPRCTVNATGLDFGSVGVISGNIDSTNGIFVACTKGTFFALTLDGGESGSSDPTRRKMTAGPHQVTYGLYTNATRTIPWGDGSNGSYQAGIGTGSTQQFVVYGRVPYQPSPVPGTYNDTIVVTVLY